LLIHLVDGTEEDVEDRMKLINAELLAFDEKLANTPQIAVINKSDVSEVTERFSDLKSELEKNVSTGEAICVSAATYDGLEDLTNSLFRNLAVIKEDQEAREAMSRVEDELRVFRPSARSSRPLAVVEGDAYRILHGRAVRIANGSDLSIYEAQLQMHKLLERLGVVQALDNLGVKGGDTVYVGQAELEWN
jgi:GTP-binding protein